MLFRHLNSFAGGLLSLAIILILMFWLLSKASSVPYVGTTIGPAANFIGTHASGAAYGY
jgi:hypothetical protein